MKQKPVHDDIDKYGYLLHYSESKDIWYASCETDKSDAWYRWGGAEFTLITRRDLPQDLTSI